MFYSTFTAASRPVNSNSRLDKYFKVKASMMRTEKKVIDMSLEGRLDIAKSYEARRHTLLLRQSYDNELSSV